MNVRLRQLAFSLLVLVFVVLAPGAYGAVPTVGPIRGKVVFVNVPHGYKTVTLQQRTGQKAKPWKMLGKKQVGPDGEMIGFLLKSAVARRALYVVGERVTPETSTVGAGARLFLADPALVSSGGYTGTGGMMFGAVALSSKSLDTVSVSSSATASVSRDVVESDIWRVAGDRLYFFNQLRGLQVFDISDPDEPTMLGQLREPNRGEQMYLLDADHVAMLTRPAYYFSLYAPISLSGAAGAPQNSPGSGAVVIASVKRGKPVELARISYPGYLVESRLVGEALYVVSQVYADNNYGLQVTSYDLSNPAKPKQTDTLNIGSWGNTIAATDRFLFVVRYDGEDWRRSAIDIIDISDPNGALVRRGKIQTAGQVWDKFKLQLKGDVLTVVSAVPRDWNIANSQTRTMVENFSLSTPATPVKLGSLELGVGETVRATRFVDDRLYVVTFFTIDPLWVVSLADPNQPTLLGELEVPGFSTYIEPLGDRLVAVGRVDSRTAVSLFDVSNPAAPTLLSQLPLGEGYSYSEANWDEKAFSVIPEHNLILVPYSGYERGSGWASRVQLIDLRRDGLTKRGVVDQGFAARRTEIVGDRILAISSTDLVTVDFADRDHPRVTSDVEIAWRVDRVFLKGKYLVEIGGSSNSRSSSPPNINIATAVDPDSTLDGLALEDVPVTGATVRDGKLYIAQQKSVWWSPLYKLDGTIDPTTTPPKNPLIVSVFDLSLLPKIKRIGRTETDVDPSYGYGAPQLEPAWPNETTLVWVRAQWSSWWWYYPRPIIMFDSPVAFAGGGLLQVAATPALTGQTVSLAKTGSLSLANTNLVSNAPVTTPADAPVTLAATSMVASSSLRMIAPWYRTREGHEMLVFDVTDATAPTYVAKVDVRIGQTGDWSAPIALNGKLYLSSMAYDASAEI